MATTKRALLSPEEIYSFMRLPLYTEVSDRMQSAISDPGSPMRARRKLAMHPNLSEKTEIKQAKDPEWTVRLETARRSRYESAQRILSNDSHWRILAVLNRNPKLSKPLRKKLTSSPDLRVSQGGYQGSIQPINLLRLTSSYK